MIWTARSSSIARARASDLRREAVHEQRFGDLRADAHHRIERRHRFLEDEADARAADLAHLVLRQRQQIAALEHHPAAGDASRRLHAGE